MKTHLESINSIAVKEVMDEYSIFECSKGHKWEETLENRFGCLPLPLDVPVPNGDNICPFCLSELLANLGRVTIRECLNSQ